MIEFSLFLQCCVSAAPGGFFRGRSIARSCPSGVSCFRTANLTVPLLTGIFFLNLEEGIYFTITFHISLSNLESSFSNTSDFWVCLMWQVAFSWTWICFCWSSEKENKPQNFLGERRFLLAHPSEVQPVIAGWCLMSLLFLSFFFFNWNIFSRMDIFLSNGNYKRRYVLCMSL